MRNTEFKDPKPFEHRDLMEIVPPQVDFDLKSKPEPIDNPNFISVY